jgi:hypothetical protein
MCALSLKRLAKKGILRPNRITDRLLWPISQLDALLNNEAEHPSYASYRKHGRFQHGK